jgi:hypothetical protein
MLRSDDGAVTWTQMNLNFGSYNINSVGGFDALNLTIVGDNYLILHTTDGGNSWLASPGIVNLGNLHSVVYFNATDGVIVGDAGMVLKTRDGGFNWKQIVVQTPNMNPAAPLNLMSVAFSSLNTGVTVGQNGVNYYSADGGDSWTSTPPAGNRNNALNNAPKNNKVALNQNYPNPFNPSTVISYQLPFDAVVSLKVYDMLGREVKSLVNNSQTAGSYNFRFDGSNLSSGIYFYVLKAASGANEFSKTMRMILTK